MVLVCFPSLFAVLASHILSKSISMSPALEAHRGHLGPRGILNEAPTPFLEREHFKPSNLLTWKGVFQAPTQRWSRLDCMVSFCRHWDYFSACGNTRDFVFSFCFSMMVKGGNANWASAKPKRRNNPNHK